MLKAKTQLAVLAVGLLLPTLGLAERNSSGSSSEDRAVVEQRKLFPGTSFDEVSGRKSEAQRIKEEFGLSEELAKTYEDVEIARDNRDDWKNLKTVGEGVQLAVEQKRSKETSLLAKQVEAKPGTAGGISAAELEVEGCPVDATPISTVADSLGDIRGLIDGLSNKLSPKSASDKMKFFADMAKVAKKTIDGLNNKKDEQNEQEEQLTESELGIHSPEVQMELNKNTTKDLDNDALNIATDFIKWFASPNGLAGWLWQTHEDDKATQRIAKKQTEEIHKKRKALRDVFLTAAKKSRKSCNQNKSLTLGDITQERHRLFKAHKTALLMNNMQTEKTEKFVKDFATRSELEAYAINCYDARADVESQLGDTSQLAKNIDAVASGQYNAKKLNKDLDNLIASLGAGMKGALGNVKESDDEENPNPNPDGNGLKRALNACAVAAKHAEKAQNFNKNLGGEINQLNQSAQQLAMSGGPQGGMGIPPQMGGMGMPGQNPHGGMPGMPQQQPGFGGWN